MAKSNSCSACKSPCYRDYSPCCAEHEAAHTCSPVKLVERTHFTDDSYKTSICGRAQQYSRHLTIYESAVTCLYCLNAMQAPPVGN